MGRLGYQHVDLVAAKNMADIQMVKLNKAIESRNYAEVCSQLRAVQDSCNHALQVAASLSLGAHLTEKNRR